MKIRPVIAAELVGLFLIFVGIFMISCAVALIFAGVALVAYSEFASEDIEVEDVGDFS